MPFSKEQVLPNLHFIERGYLNGNHFLAVGEDSVLIDSGYLGGLSETLAALKSLGCDWKKTARIIATHCHCDHVGANGFIQQTTGCRVSMHPVGREIINAKDGLAAWWDYYGQEAEFFDCTDSISDGEEVRLGGHRFTALHAPGHSRDILVFYSKEHRILLSSDALWENDMAVITAVIEGEDAAEVWLKSLDRLDELKVEVVYPGHGGRFENFGEALAKTRTRLLRLVAAPVEAADDLLRKIMVYTLLMRGGAQEATFFESLMRTPWFPATIDSHFGGEYRSKYDEVLERLKKRGAVTVSGGVILPMVKP